MTAHYRLNGVLLCGSDFAGTRALTGYKMENEWPRETLAVVLFHPLQREILCPRVSSIIAGRARAHKI